MKRPRNPHESTTPLQAMALLDETAAKSDWAWNRLRSALKEHIWLSKARRSRRPPTAPAEWVFSEWSVLPDRPALHCECGDPANYFGKGEGYVFVCRHEDISDIACGRHCCACVGSGETDLCGECWIKAWGTHDEEW